MTIDEIKQALREMKEICANKTECRDCPFAIVGRKVICCPVIDMDEYAIFPCEWPIDYPEDDHTDKANVTDPLTMNDYQRMARRTAGTKRKSDKMEEALLGLAGEVGELCDYYKKHKHQGHDFDCNHMIEEAGDVAWYLAELAEALHTTLETIAERNIEKLRKRYPDGFDPERSMHREGEA